MRLNFIIFLLAFILFPKQGEAQSSIIEANSLLDAAQISFASFAEKINADDP